METAKDLNFGSDEMQVVLTALHDVGRRIKEVGENAQAPVWWRAFSHR